ncbi:hypothetical protein [Paenibacillus roseipurpureus]|uniref:VRR-NUC domain-containing protein n=1 Tax=Paenibacillus roseopurpureus TaxID=2918901 RepID=A0AA96LVH6_9BACL|nr:hypothetical protein [Paenibacillus sp. MBLB1832]WNR46824.1 hypothetical protein MJB10_12260 [Paenibacillus sp. MBLB1832]
MGIKITIPTRLLTFKASERDDWRNGLRENCTDEYLRTLSGTKGFGEYIVGKHYEDRGYKYLHRFGIFGGNKIGTFPDGDLVIKNRFGEDFFVKSRTLYPSFNEKVRLELPDLLIYKPDFSEIKFVEVKRQDTNDKLNTAQVRTLALLNLLLECDVEIFEVFLDSNAKQINDVIWEF